jgi:hypothetical protein
VVFKSTVSSAYNVMTIMKKATEIHAAGIHQNGRVEEIHKTYDI